MPVLATAAIALVGAAVFDRLGVPAGALLGALVAVALVNAFGPEAGVAQLPEGVRFVSYAALGWLIAQGVTRETFGDIGRAAVPILVIVAVLLAVGLALGWVLIRAGLMDPATAYLATSPGALSQMSAVAGEIGADAALVATVHTIRVVVLVMVAPLIGRLASSAAGVT